MGILKSIISIFLSLFCLLTGHTVVVDPAIEPTCESVGYSEGSHCERCGKKFTEEDVRNVCDVKDRITV